MNTIEKVLNEKYGVGSLVAPWEAVMWAVAQIETELGSVEAAKQLKKLNRKREKYGSYTNIPEYGTPLFKAYFNK